MAALKVSGIYAIVNTISGKMYVGSAVNIDQRWAVHRHSLREGKHHSRHLQRAWDKHGADAFALNILVVCEKADLIAREQEHIDLLKPAYNSAPKAGNCLGVRWSDEARARHSLVQKANPTFKGRKHSPETLAKMRESQTGRPSPTKGKTRDPEAVAKTAAAHRGRKRSEETRAKIAAKAKGRPFVRHNDDYRAKLSAASKGRPISPEHMAALQAGRARRVYTEEQRARISAKLKEQYDDGARSRERSPEYREKIAATLRGRKLSPEHRAKVSEAMTGKTRGPYKRQT